MLEVGAMLNRMLNSLLSSIFKEQLSLQIRGKLLWTVKYLAMFSGVHEDRDLLANP